MGTRTIQNWPLVDPMTGTYRYPAEQLPTGGWRVCYITISGNKRSVIWDDWRLETERSISRDNKWPLETVKIGDRP